MAQGKRFIGIGLIGAGVVVVLLAILFIGSGYVSGQVQLAGAILGVSLCGVLPLLVLGGAGGYLLVTGQAEAREQGTIRQRERLLGLIQAQGQVPLATLMDELQMSRDEVVRAIAALVNLRLFAGYIDWERNIFYSQDAAQMAQSQCPKCGATHELVGKGMVRCPYCGAAIFLPPGTA